MYCSREQLLRQKRAKQQAIAKKLMDAQAKEEKKRKAEEYKVQRGAPTTNSFNTMTAGTNVKCANPLCRALYNKPKHSRQSCPADWSKCLNCKIEFCNACQEVKTGHDMTHIDA